jgi:ribosomal protein S27AE
MGDNMKTCPECGSILADYELWCEFCGFNPDYDMGDWEYD